MATIDELNEAFGRVQAKLGRPMHDQPNDIQGEWANLVFRANNLGNADWSGLPASGSYNGAVPALNGAADAMHNAQYSSAASVRSAMSKTGSALSKLDAVLP